jgi:hypothetical protein
MMIDAGRAGAQRIPAAIPNVPTERRAGFVKDTPNESSRAQRAAAAAQQLERLAPRLFTEPDVQFPLAAAHRNQGLTRQSDRYFLGFSRTRGHDAWWACSMGEQWLNEPKGECPKPAIHAAVASLKPRLDGKLDDAMWKHARAERLTSLHDDDEDWPAQVQLAYDNEYLFVGVRCTSAGAQRATASTGARPRDPDLSAHDRVELLIDIDRDYATFYRLVIDRRGWVADSLWGAKSWDPDWFVAAASDDDGAWTAEAAIPWSALVGRRPESRYVWALGVQRTVPRRSCPKVLGI